MKRKLRVVLIAALSAVLVVSAAMVIRETIQYKQGQDVYDEAKELASVPDLTSVVPVSSSSSAPVSSSGSSSTGSAVSSAAVSSSAPDPYEAVLRNMDFAALRKVNSEVVGWIAIPGTIISYPLMQAKDNDYYLTHAWSKYSTIVGSIFLECKNKRDLSDFNTIVYGHHMNNGSMFASLRYYKDSSYQAAHPNIYITDDSGTRRYEIFSAYEISTSGMTYQLGFSNDVSKQKFLNFCTKQSVISTGIKPTVKDKIVTLSTCIGYGHATRWVVQGILRETTKK